MNDAKQAIALLAMVFFSGFSGFTLCQFLDRMWPACVLPWALSVQGDK